MGLYSYHNRMNTDDAPVLADFRAALARTEDGITEHPENLFYG